MLNIKTKIIVLGIVLKKGVNNMIEAIVMVGWTFIGIVSFILIESGSK